MSADITIKRIKQIIPAVDWLVLYAVEGVPYCLEEAALVCWALITDQDGDDTVVGLAHSWGEGALDLPSECDNFLTYLPKAQLTEAYRQTLAADARTLLAQNRAAVVRGRP